MALPWFHEMSRRGSLGIADCGACMQSRSTKERQALGCGYSPPGGVVMPWQPPGGRVGYQGAPLTACAGYTTNLPEVVEASVAYRHWKHGALDRWIGKDEPDDALLDSLLVIENTCKQFEVWISTPAKDGGGNGP